MLQTLWSTYVDVMVAGVIVPAVTHPVFTILTLAGLTGVAIWRA